MDQLVINAKVRTGSGKKAAKQLRTTGRLPAIMYNAEGKSTMIDIDEVEFNKVWRTITPTTLISLNVEGVGTHDAFIKDTEYNIRTDKVLHADFFEPDADENIVLDMKLQYTGTPAGVLKGGFLLKHVPAISIKAVPKAVPARVVVDISKVNIGEKFCVKDLALGKDVTILTEAETPLVSVAAAR